MGFTFLPKNEMDFPHNVKRYTGRNVHSFAPSKWAWMRNEAKIGTSINKGQIQQ